MQNGNNTFKVSVIIPVYNAQKYVKDAIESALSIEEVGEVLLVDDGSSDNTLELCKTLEIQNERIKVFQHKDKKNHGPAASRNIGILNATCDYVAFLDADDYYLSNRFVCEKKLFNTTTGIEVVYGCSHTIFTDEINKEKYYTYEQNNIYTLSEIVPSEKLFKALLFYWYGRLHTSTITVKKESFKKTGLFNETLKWAEDTEMWLKLSLQTKMLPGNIQTPVSLRRIHESNIVHETNKAQFYKNKMYESLFIWALQKKNSFEILNDIFNAHRLYLINQNKLSRRDFFLIKILKQHPAIIFNSFFWKKVRLLYLNDSKT